MDLAGKVALITGGASGIGAATARALAARGATVAVADLDLAGARRVAAEVGGTAHHLDVTTAAGNRATVVAVEREHGHLDIAFLNAGRTSGTDDAAALDEAAYRRALAVNVDGVIFGIDAVRPALARAGGGAIVVTASLAGLSPMPGDALYTLTKAAVVGYTRTMAPTIARDGIVLTTLCPGFADTPLIDPLRERFTAADFPLLTAEDVAQGLLDSLDNGEPGQAWYVQPGRPAAPFRFGNVPGARRSDGSSASLPAGVGEPGAGL